MHSITICKRLIAAVALISALTPAVEGIALAQGGPGSGPPLERIIVLDPGHGGRDAGLSSASGVAEKDLTLAVAGVLKELLEVNLGAKVLLTRSGDYAVNPLERAATANGNKAALFLSLHVGASRSQSADTFTAFFAAPRPGTVGVAEEHAVWKAWNRQNEPFRRSSQVLAGALQVALSAWLSGGATEPLGGDWLVLKGIGCPAAMVELGCLSNPERERSYRGEAFIRDLAGVLFGVVSKFLEDTVV